FGRPRADAAGPARYDRDLAFECAHCSLPRDPLSTRSPTRVCPTTIRRVIDGAIWVGVMLRDRDWWCQTFAVISSLVRAATRESLPRKESRGCDRRAYRRPDRRGDEGVASRPRSLP